MKTFALKPLWINFIFGGIVALNAVFIIGCKTVKEGKFNADQAAGMMTAKLPPHTLNYWSEKLIELTGGGQKYYVCCLYNGSTAWDTNALGLFDAGGHLLSFKVMNGIDDLIGTRSVFQHRDSILISTRAGMGTGVKELRYEVFTLVGNRLNQTFDCIGDEELDLRYPGTHFDHFERKVKISDNGKLGANKKFIVTSDANWFSTGDEPDKVRLCHSLRCSEEFLFDSEKQRFMWDGPDSQ